jgi:hypothetical protein
MYKSIKLVQIWNKKLVILLKNLFFIFFILIFFPFYFFFLVYKYPSALKTYQVNISIFIVERFLIRAIVIKIFIRKSLIYIQIL